PRIEPLSTLRLMRPFDAIGVKGGAMKFARRNAAMPDAPGLVRRVLKAKLEHRFCRVLLVVTQQRDARGMPRVESELESVLRRHPLDAERPRSSSGDGDAS